jgi:hypothetical protein
MIANGTSMTRRSAGSEFLGLRRDVEQALGARFDQRAYHDFVLAQGKLPDLHNLKGDPSNK